METLAWAIGGVFLLNVYALVLVLLRAPVYRVPLYRPMVWNIVLSVLPAVVLIGILAVLLTLAGPTEGNVAFWITIIAGGLVWLLLLPNAAYLITELNFNHRDPDSPVPLWYDIVQVLTLTLSGVMNALLNIVLAQLVITVILYPNQQRPFARADSWIFVAATLVLVTIGIYLGRYLRVNTWDIRHPIGFMKRLGEHFRVRANVLEAFGFCVTHTLLLGILYLIFAAPILLLFSW